MMTSEWATALADWETWLVASDRPATTRSLRLYQVRRFAAEAGVGPWEATGEALTAWVAQGGWATETRRSYRAALRVFYGWAHSTGRMPCNPAAELPPIRPAQGRPRPTPLAVVRTALADASPRVQLMVMLAARQGLRRGEIALVHSSDLREDLGGWSLLVHGKGARRRLVPLDEDVAAALRRQPEGWAFPGRMDGHLSPARVGELVSEVLGAGWTTHTLRHRFATSAYASAHDLFAVQTLLGHQSPETTRRYVELPDGALRDAVRGARLSA